MFAPDARRTYVTALGSPVRGRGKGRVQAFDVRCTECGHVTRTVGGGRRKADREAAAHDRTHAKAGA